MTRVQLQLVNVSEAARLTGVPRSTVNNWVRRDERLQAAGLAADGTALYDLAAVRELATARSSRRRRRLTKPDRR